MTRRKLLFFFFSERKTTIKTVDFFSSKPRLCFCPLVHSSSQTQQDQGCVSTVLKSMLAPDITLVTKGDRFLLTRGLFSLIIL